MIDSVLSLWIHLHVNADAVQQSPKVKCLSLATTAEELSESQETFTSALIAAVISKRFPTLRNGNTARRIVEISIVGNALAASIHFTSVKNTFVTCAEIRCI
jgi:hypothetical protein